MSGAQDVEALLARLPRLPRLDSSNKLRVGSGKKGVSPPLVLSWPGLEEVLPDGGLPRGVVELAAPRLRRVAGRLRDPAFVVEEYPTADALEVEREPLNTAAFPGHARVGGT